MSNRIVTFLAIAGFCAVSIFFFDKPLAMALHHPPSIVSDAAALVSALGLPWFWYLAAVAGIPVGWRLRARDMARARDVLYISVALISTWVVVATLKILFARPRPELFFDAGLYDFQFFSIGPLLRSFPSGHTACAFALASVAGRHLAGARPMLMAFAVSMALSRLVLGVHFLSDVVAGAYLGILVPALIWRAQTFVRLGAAKA
ncbi:MAG: phosphatase PAP2 family protein [Sphingomonadales bacterium]